MMDTTFWFGMNGAMVPSSVTMPRDTLVMEDGSVTLHDRVSMRMSFRNAPDVDIGHIARAVIVQ